MPSDPDLASVALVEVEAKQAVLAEIVKVGNDQDRRVPFKLDRARSLRIYALGEADGQEFADWGWIEDASGKTVWSMATATTGPAGGAEKNRLADEVVKLPKGAYTLRYRTDDSHAYGKWNARAPRDKEHYGITVYAAD